MKHLLFESDLGLPPVRLPVCPKCEAFLQSPSPDCPEAHGTAHPRRVLGAMCVYLGHVMVAAGKGYPRCLRCQRPRAEVVA